MKGLHDDFVAALVGGEMAGAEAERKKAFADWNGLLGSPPLLAGKAHAMTAVLDSEIG